jgi:hypothetical protein
MIIFTAHKVHHGFAGIRHGFEKGIMVGCPEMRRIARSVDMGLAVRGCHADGHVFQCAAEAAHQVSLEMGKHQYGAIGFQILSHEIF